jgi:transcriptional regulator with XRE-family HTH domain
VIAKYKLMNIKILLGTNIRRTRETKGWSQDKLSEEPGLHSTYISGIERGVRNPSILIVQQVASALHVTVSDLFKNQEKK